MAVIRGGEIYSWGEGSHGRLGLGFVEETKETPTQVTPYKMENVLDSKSILRAGAGATMSGVVMNSGTVYTWGKGLHEKMKVDDYQEYSTPYVIMD
jgi:alpha-tubulin suppressor-like RCC1 family protein